MKKAVIPIWLSLTMAIIVIGLLLVFFFMFLRGDQTPMTVAVKNSFTLDAQNLLASYLNAPVTVNNEEITFADLIKLSYPGMLQKTGRYYPVLARETARFMKKNTITYSLGRTKNKRMFWITFQNKPRTPEQQESRRPADLIIPIIPDRVPVEGTCMFAAQPDYCPDKAATYLPVTQDKSVYVAVWSVDEEQ